VTTTLRDTHRFGYPSRQPAEVVGVLVDDGSARAVASVAVQEAVGREAPVRFLQVVASYHDEGSAHPLGDREVGELRLRGPSVMPGYYNEPELTREAFAGGWLKTGDLGYLANGNVHICGRSKAFA